VCEEALEIPEIVRVDMALGSNSGAFPQLGFDGNEGQMRAVGKQRTVEMRKDRGDGMLGMDEKSTTKHHPRNIYLILEILLPNCPYYQDW
jgi:hypothetical protein